MAFMLNICRFGDCGIEFPFLDDLIRHIEETHIDAVLKHHSMLNPPYSIALSYIIKYTTPWTREVHPAQPTRPKQQLQRAPALAKPRSSPSECLDDTDFMSHSEDSNDSWTTMEEYGPEYILRYGTKLKTARHKDGTDAHAGGGGVLDKPFACPVPGCKKRYKNINGIKYHSKNGHKKDGKVQKAYKCHCGKSYTVAQGLKNHIATNHSKYEHTFATVTCGRNTDLVVTASLPQRKFVRMYNPSSGQHYDATPGYTYGNMTNHIHSPPAAEVTVESIHHGMYV